MALSRPLGTLAASKTPAKRKGRPKLPEGNVKAVMKHRLLQQTSSQALKREFTDNKAIAM
jgi:hypothetical protein